MFSRRSVLKGFAGAAFAQNAVSPLIGPAFAQSGVPPIIFVHGNGDHAALWHPTIWRFESNGFARDRLFAFNFTDPLARDDNSVAQPLRSSSDDQLRELTAMSADVRHATGARQVALVANSRGGYAVRNYVLSDPAAASNVSHIVLCGVPNHGVFAWDVNLGNEFNGNGPFLKRLNAGDLEVVPGPAFLTLRSDGMDKYAQSDGRFVGRAGVPTGITAEGPALKGATNLVIGPVDHRETAFSPRAFREIYKFIAGREPDRLAIVPEDRVALSGLVTGLPGGIATNRPVKGALVEVFRVAPQSGDRIGEAVYRQESGSDGSWGPANVEPGSALEFVLPLRIIRSPIFIARLCRDPQNSFICARADLSGKPRRGPERSLFCRDRGAISGCRAMLSSLMDKSRRT
ncbi:MAG: hypothetical protein NVSMB26_13390 [Beijerinckiaceae bacterium]